MDSGTARCQGASEGAQPSLLRPKKLILTLVVCDIPEHPQHVVSVHKSLWLVFSNALSSQSKHCLDFIFAPSLFIALGISLTPIRGPERKAKAFLQTLKSGWPFVKAWSCGLKQQSLEATFFWSFTNQ